MSYDYGADINIGNYKYIKSIYVTETEGVDHTHYVVRLDLTSDNFNFTLCEGTNGEDLNFSITTNGTNMLRHWVAYWRRQDEDAATVFVKVPNVLAYETKRVYVIFGGQLDDRTDPDNVGLVFAEDFLDRDFFYTRWTASTSIPSDYFNSLGMSMPMYRHWIRPIGNYLTNRASWIIESCSYWNSVNESFQYYFSNADENHLDIRWRSGSSMYHNVVSAGSTPTYSISYIGGERGSLNEFHASYYEPTDKVTMRSLNRSTYPDVESIVERSVYGDTRLNTVDCYSGDWNQQTQELRMVWFLIREHRTVEPTIDYTDLYEPYETIVHQDEDYTEYTEDLTRVDLFHLGLTGVGSDPYKLSNNSDTDVWETDDTAGALVDGVEVLIGFGSDSTDLTSREYVHFDDGHEKYYGAVKLSDDALDGHSRTTWRPERTSGWACIDFGEDAQAVSAVSIKASSSMGNAVVSYQVQGTFGFPTLDSTEWMTLASGVGIAEEQWQPQHFYNETPFRYYRINCVEETGTVDIELDEWSMHEFKSHHKAPAVAQFRLLPDFENDQQKYFPKYVGLFGSNNGQDWTEIFGSYTYTPYYEYTHGRWQHYSLLNERPFYVYKMVFRGNWNGNSGKMVVAGWEMVELLSEAYTYRVLQGGADSGIVTRAIWALEDSGIDGIFYAVNGEFLNKVDNNELSSFKTMPLGLTDINVIQ
jgi:hypothetical protein